MDPIIQQAITGAAALGGIFLGVSIFLSNKKSATGVLFLFLTISTSLASIANYFSLNDQQNMIFWIRLVMFFAVFLAVSFYLFSVVFPSEKINIKKTTWIVTILVTLVDGYIAISSLLFDHVEIAGGHVYPVPGKGIFIYMGSFFVLILLALYNLIKGYIKTSGVLKAQYRYLLWGLGLTFLFIIVFNVLLVNVFRISSFQFLAGLFTLIYLGFTALAILKHHLFNLKVIVTEAAVIIINLILAIEIFTSKTPTERMLRVLFLALVVYGSYLLLQSIFREIKFREELQKLTDQLAQANAHLKELDQMKTEFVSLASHELLTPVSAIEGYLSMLLDEHMAKVEDPKAMKYLNNVYLSAKRLARLIADMLNISRIEEGRLLVEKKDVDLSQLIKQVVDEIKFKAEEKKQKIVFQNPDGWQTYADPDKVKEVLVNLIGNSIKYSKNPGTITIHVEKIPTPWVSEKWEKIEEDIKNRPLDDQEAINSAVDPHMSHFVGPQQILIGIHDQGIGIPKDELPRLFKKFHRVGNYTTQESQGSGLGLYISRALVELHHGRIWADSEGEGKGSTFTFSLPDLPAKSEILKVEAEVPQDKEKLKPLAHPTKAAEDI